MLVFSNESSINNVCSWYGWVSYRNKQNAKQASLFLINLLLIMSWAKSDSINLRRNLQSKVMKQCVHSSTEMLFSNTSFKHFFVTYVRGSTQQMLELQWLKQFLCPVVRYTYEAVFRIRRSKNKYKKEAKYLFYAAKMMMILVIVRALHSQMYQH